MRSVTMENKMLLISTHKKLKTNFLIWFSILVVLGFLCFTMKVPFPKLSLSVSINLQQLLIFSLLGGIPGGLVWTKRKMKTLAEISNIGDRLKQYEKYVRIRQTVFFVLGFFILLMQLFTVMNGALMLFLVVACLCMFIIPTRDRLETEAHLVEPEA